MQVTERQQKAGNKRMATKRQAKETLRKLRGIQIKPRGTRHRNTAKLI